MTQYFNRLYLFILLLPIAAFSQIKVTSLPSNQSQNIEKFLFGGSETRNVFLLNDHWRVYSEDDNQNKVSISVPAIFDGDDVLVFERKIEFTQAQIDSKSIKIGFLGLNYSAEISINSNIIYNHPGGSYPFEITLPKDLLFSDRANKISVKLNRKLDSENTYPVKQRFLFPEFNGGIIRDVYVKIVPRLSISKIDFTASFTSGMNIGKLNFDIGIENASDKTKFNEMTQFVVRVNLFEPGSSSEQAKGDFLQTISTEGKFEAHCPIEITNPLLWSPSSPNVYTCEVSILKDGTVIDKQTRQVSIYNLTKNENSFLLNGTPFTLKGTTYLLNETAIRKTNLYDQLKDNLNLIKQTGFNAVRFSKSYPHPYALKLCQELGLIALIEFPLNSVPEEFVEQADYQLKTVGFLREFISSYYNYSNAFAVGVGSSYLPNSEITKNFISRLASEVKKQNLLSYASFCGIQSELIDHIDLIGLELFSVPKDLLLQKLTPELSAIGNASLFISELTYPNHRGNAGGYLVRNSIEAQAKYFRDIISLSKQLKISGYFVNSLFGYRGAFSSMYSGYSNEAIYKFSILDRKQNLNSLSYKVLFSELNNENKVTIPIGVRKDENPILFILIALFLSIVMAVLINTKRKFRDDATRALIRSYNFFADIRDHRIISGAHTFILMLIISGAASLLFTILLFYLRSNLLLEKLLLSFASTRVMNAVSYLAWNPQNCLIILFALAIIKIVLLSLIIKFASMFIKTRVMFSSIYFMVVWAFLPFTLFLPLELVLAKVLGMETFGVLMVVIIAIFIIWMFLRLLKGIYVIFDVPLYKVYVFSALILSILFGSVVAKYQLTHSIIYYVVNAFKQYSSMNF